MEDIPQTSEIQPTDVQKNITEIPKENNLLLSTHYSTINPYFVLIIVSIACLLPSIGIIVYALKAPNLGLEALGIAYIGMMLSFPLFFACLIIYTIFSKTMSLKPIPLLLKIIIAGLITTSSYWFLNIASYFAGYNYQKEVMEQNTSFSAEVTLISEEINNITKERGDAGQYSEKPTFYDFTLTIDFKNNSSNTYITPLISIYATGTDTENPQRTFKQLLVSTTDSTIVPGSNILTFKEKISGMLLSASDYSVLFNEVGIPRDSIQYAYTIEFHTNKINKELKIENVSPNLRVMLSNTVRLNPNRKWRDRIGAINRYENLGLQFGLLTPLNYQTHYIFTDPSVAPPEPYMNSDLNSFTIEGNDGSIQFTLRGVPPECRFSGIPLNENEIITGIQNLLDDNEFKNWQILYDRFLQKNVTVTYCYRNSQQPESAKQTLIEIMSTLYPIPNLE